MPGGSESGIVVRDIESIDEMGAVEELQRAVWGCADIDVVPRMLLRPACEVGGVLVGAFDGALCVGFAFGLVGLEGGALSLHSHMLAVLPPYGGREIGRRLKLAQRERALARGIRLMTWTFDPLQSRNAHLNFTRLGVLSDDYRLNYYGDTSTSPLHAATGTDRLWVTWRLDSERVARRAASPRGEADRAREQFEKAAPLVRSSAAGEPETSPLVRGIPKSCGDFVSVEIPANTDELRRADPASALRWRVATRVVFLWALGAGYVAAEFVRFSRDGRERGAYLLRRGGGRSGVGDDERERPDVTGDETATGMNNESVRARGETAWT